MAKKKTPKRSKKKSNKGYVISVFVVLIVIAALYYAVTETGLIKKEIAATVNGDIITMQELNQKYDALPEQYKMFITKDLLLDQLINAKLLLLEAEVMGVEVSMEEVEAEIDRIKIQSFDSDEEFLNFLKENNMELEVLKQQTHDQLTIAKLLDMEILSKIDIDESRVKAFYDNNAELMGNFSYNDVKEQIRQSMLEDLSGGAIQTYTGQLRAKADIIKKGEFETEALTFTETEDELCTIGDRPIIRFYTTSTCAPCKWANDAFYSAVRGGDFQVYHWELDTGDNLITTETETSIPKEELEIFKKYNPKSTVPSYVFGCKYIRSGNGHDDIMKEQQEFLAVLAELE
ncbi:MAG: SurA N-terminal domain-containing protein [Nanoarchaeota archaeon]